MNYEFWQAYLITLFFEVPVYWYACRKYGKTAKVAAVSVLLSTVTLPVVWFVLPPLLIHDYPLYFAVAELFAWLGEALMLKMAFGKMKSGNAVLIAFVANAISASIGLVIAFLL